MAPSASQNASSGLPMGSIPRPRNYPPQDEMMKDFASDPGSALGFPHNPFQYMKQEMQNAGQGQQTELIWVPIHRKSPRMPEEKDLTVHVAAKKYSENYPPPHNLRFMMRHASSPFSAAVMNCPTYMDFLWRPDGQSNSIYLLTHFTTVLIKLKTLYKILPNC